MSIYPNADHSVKGTDAGPYTGGPPKGVLHTTEGSNGNGAIGAFKSTGSWPHFLVGEQGYVWQFIDTNLSARALQHPSGTVPTNTDHAIQIEIVGFAAQPTAHSSAQWTALKSLMRWIEGVEGVKLQGPGRAFATAYGQNNLRFTSSQWDNFNAWCGHCHVPNNDHWDPGAIDINSLLPPKEVRPMYSPLLVLEPIAAMLKYNGGVYLVADSGALYAFGAPGIIGANGQSYFAGRHAAILWPGDTTDPTVPAYIHRVAGGLIIQTTSNEFYGPFTQ